ncbi:MAG: hypothetical protein QM731_00615 [Chitinophagaceae bacterium]
MVTPEKIDEIKKRLTKGEPHGEIIEELKSEGYTQEDINQLIAAHKYDMRNFYLFFAIFLFLLGAYNFITNDNYLLFIFSTLMFVMLFP